MLKEGTVKVNIMKSLKTGDIDILVISSSKMEAIVRKRLKDFWIPKRLYEKNRDKLVKWDRLRVEINETRQSLRTLKEGIDDMKGQLKRWGDKPFFKLRVPMLEEAIKRDQQKIRELKKELRIMKRDYQPLNKIVKGFRDYATLVQMEVIN
jgi:SMC interacting uncharacterized protein involved in chromosome segregation